MSIPNETQQSKVEQLMLALQRYAALEMTIRGLYMQLDEEVWDEQRKDLPGCLHAALAKAVNKPALLINCSINWSTEYTHGEPGVVCFVVGEDGSDYDISPDGVSSANFARLLKDVHSFIEGYGGTKFKEAQIAPCSTDEEVSVCLNALAQFLGEHNIKVTALTIE